MFECNGKTQMRIIIIGIIFTVLTVHANAKPLSVVTSINPYYLIVRAMGDTLTEVYNILPPSASPHTYSPVPSDVLKLSNADLIIMNGLHLEHGIMHKISDIRGKVISVGDSLFGYNEAGNINPHIWLSPDNILYAITLVENALLHYDSIHADIYRQRADSMRLSVTEMDSIIKADIAGNGTIPIITFHNSFMYFLNHYGFEIAGVVEKVPGREPTPRDLADLKKVIIEKDIKVIFIEPQLSPRPAEVLAKEAGLMLMELDPLGYALNAQSINDIIELNYKVIKSARDSID